MVFMTPLAPVIYAKLLGSSGGSVTPQSVLTAMESMNSQQQSDAREAIGAGEPLTPEEIAEAAAEWLEDNITNPSNPPIDKSLAVSNAAADSATVGGILYGNAAPADFNVSPWIIGANINAAGEYIQNQYTIYTAVSEAYYNVYPYTVFYLNGPGKDANNVPLFIFVHEYDASNNWIRRTSVGNQGNAVESVVVGSDCSKVRFVFGRTSSTGVAMTQTDIDNYFGLKASLGYGKNSGGFCGRIEMLEANVLGLHTVPETPGVLNLVKRCRQMTDIKWTPAVDLPRFMKPGVSPEFSSGYSVTMNSPYIGVFKAGIEYTGIPYGRSADYPSGYGWDHLFVGSYVDFETFVTAVRNANSMICKESEGSTLLHHSIPYSAVCSTLVSYALNVAYTVTDEIPNISGMTLIGQVDNSGTLLDLKKLKIGDVLHYQAVHVAIITDIVKDGSGNVTAVEISEGAAVGEANRDIEGGKAGGLCRRRGWLSAEFFTGWGPYSVYRYNGINAIPYTPSPFVNVGNEPDYFRYDDLPCMPYQGNGFKFKAGYIPNTKILVNATGYGFLRVFKDGSEITGSPFAIAEGAEYVEVGFSAAGSYEAYLCNMSGGSNTEVTAKCNWTVES